MPPPTNDPYSVSTRLLDEDATSAAGDQNVDDELEANGGPPPGARSHYVLTKNEVARGIANRFVHSRSYIFLYLGMACLSATTVALSLAEGCPGLAFYILEVVVNSAMILEVGIRLIAFGKQFWKSPFNTLDLILTLFCAMTLLVLAFADCGSTSKEEELLDTLLLVARNVLQFARLAAVMRKSGQSIFTRPKPIDLTLPHRSGGGNLDIDLEDDDEEEARPLGGRGQVVFDAERNRRLQQQQQQRRAAQARAEQSARDDTDTWAALG